MVDYLVEVLVYFFGGEFVVDFFPTWRKYLYLFSWIHVLFSSRCLESKVIYLDLYGLNFYVLFSWLLLLFFLLFYSVTKFFKSCLLWPFSTNISIKTFSSFLIYFSDHIECALWRTPLNTLLRMLRSKYDVPLVGMLVMAFLWCILNSYLLLMVLVMLMSQHWYYMV